MWKEPGLGTVVPLMMEDLLGTDEITLDSFPSPHSNPTKQVVLIPVLQMMTQSSAAGLTANK